MSIHIVSLQVHKFRRAMLGISDANTGMGAPASVEVNLDESAQQSHLNK